MESLLKNRTGTADREETLRTETSRTENRLKSLMETADREEHLRMENRLRNRTATTDKMKRALTGPAFLCNSRYFEQIAKYFKFFVKYI